MFRDVKKIALTSWLVGVALALALLAPAPLRAQQAVELTLESAVEMAMEHSYRVRQLQLGIERTRHLLQAERAELKSQVYLDVRAPEFEAVSDYKWNADLRRNEVVRENSRLWRADLAVRQPVILLGYPTNGYLSLNNRVYRYAQLGGGRDVTYYNRYFIAYEQPLFQPNRLKNELEEAELDLEEEELEFQEDVVDLIDDIADDYYELFELAYERVVYAAFAENLERAMAAAGEAAEADSTRDLDVSQVRVELANGRERLRQAESGFRLEAERMKQRLRLDERDPLRIDPALDVRPVRVDVEEAVRYGMTLRPRLRELELRKRQDELDIDEARGRNSFRVDLELTYGREMQDPRFGELWEEPSNSYTVGVRAYVPIWDWGERRERVRAEEIGLEQTALYMEEARSETRLDVQNAVRNLEEFQQRALDMEETLALARTVSEANLDRYRAGRITVSDLLQSFARQRETATNFLDAYLGYRGALLDLQELTYYDFEHDAPLLDRFRIRPGG